MAKLTNPYKGKCPDCTDGLLIERTNKETKNTFLGCSEWPGCKHTERGGSNPSKPFTYAYSYDDEDDFDGCCGLDILDMY